jgi:hypothetical protein
MREADPGLPWLPIHTHGLSSGAMPHHAFSRLLIQYYTLFQTGDINVGNRFAPDCMIKIVDAAITVLK